jgi:hypothetical protein
MFRRITVRFGGAQQEVLLRRWNPAAASLRSTNLIIAPTTVFSAADRERLKTEFAENSRTMPAAPAAPVATSAAAAVAGSRTASAAAPVQAAPVPATPVKAAPVPAAPVQEAPSRSAPQSPVKIKLRKRTASTDEATAAAPEVNAAPEAPAEPSGEKRTRVVLKVR